MKLQLVASLAVCVCAAVSAQEPVRYTVRFPAPQTHYLEVTASIPAGKPEIEIYLPVWTPGSYLVREYSRHIDHFQAKTPSGDALVWQKTRKNRWKIQTRGAGRIEAVYQVYARENSVQGNWVDAGFAMLNGAPNFVTLVGAEKRPYEVKLELPASWKLSISGMEKKPGEPNTYLAKDYDQLVDSPIYAGSGPVHEFTAAGRKHFLVNEGEGPMWDGPASSQDVAKLVEENAKLWNGLPYDFYVFFNMLLETGGGLEHKNSTWMNGSKWAYGNTEVPAPGSDAPRRANRLGWLGLVSHEYFHLWNVKRLRPVELGPFDYENEVYTKSLWLAEGVTSYYGGLNVRRAKLSTTDQYLQELSGAIRSLQTTPGRLALPVESSSYDAWIRLYRPDENTGNTAISYYTKGELVGLLLDAKIRKVTNDAKSLDDVMRLAFQRYSGAHGYTPAQFRAVASEVAGQKLDEWFVKTLDSTDELDYGEFLDWYGLRFKPAGDKAKKRINTGISVRNDGGRLVVSSLKTGTSGYASGVNADDEIIAVNGYRVRPEQWPARLESYKAEGKVELTVARREKLITVALPLVEELPEAWTLEVNPQATDAQKAHLRAWVHE